jgi:hypothetical protein
MTVMAERGPRECISNSAAEYEKHWRIDLPLHTSGMSRKLRRYLNASHPPLDIKARHATALMEINGCAGRVAHGVSARRPHKLATAYLDCR